MDNKRLKMFLGITLIIVILAGVSFYIFKQLSTGDSIYFEEYVPAQEISDEQLRQTFVKLYFMDTDSKELQCESRSLDSKELLSNPYLTLVNLLISGPSVEGLQGLIPAGTIVNSASLSGDSVVLDLSANFINSTSNAKLASDMVYSIVNTLTELTEVNSVRFLIDGDSSASFSSCDFSLTEPFVRI